MFLLASDTTDNTKSRKPLLSEEDQALLRQCLGNEPKAWDLFIEKFAGLFAHIIHRTAAQRGVTLSSADRDDLIAEIMLEIIRNDISVLRSAMGMVASFEVKFRFHLGKVFSGCHINFLIYLVSHPYSKAHRMCIHQHLLLYRSAPTRL